MLIALAQSPITAQQFFEWDEKLQKDEILVREIIDIDTNYMEEENSAQELKNKKNKEDKQTDKVKSIEEKKDNNNSDEEDEFNPTLAAMESEIKPKVLDTVNNLTKNYSKLIKHQIEKLNSILNNIKSSPAKEKNYQRLVNEILENLYNYSILENLVQNITSRIKIISLEGNLLRLQ